jgi:hypothetical protein
LNKDLALDRDYAELFVEKLAKCLKNKNWAKTKKAADLAGLDRAFEILHLSNTQVEILLRNVFENIEPKTFGLPAGRIFCSVLASLVQFHSLHFMDVLFQQASR